MLKTSLFLLFLFCKIIEGSICPTLNNAITQTDIFHAAQASKDVYNDHVVEGSTVNKTPYKVVKRIHTNLFTDAGIRVIVADSGNTRMVVYRGTDGQEQLLVEGAAVFKPKAIVRYGNQDVKIMRYFWDAFELVSYDLRPYITDPSKKYIITGHSLGGALASIMALNGTQLFHGSIWAHPQSSLITFGQPRTGDQSYANVHDSLISTYRKLRFVHLGDIVARNPGHEFGWRHHSRAVYMGEESTGGWFGWLGDELKDEEVSDEELSELIHEADEEETQEIEESDIGDSLALKDIDLPTDMSEDTLEDAPPPAQDSNMRKFWTICSTQRAYFCITYTKHFVPNIKDHGIDNYVKSAEETHIFRTRQKTEKSSFNEALVAACQELEG